MGLPSLKASFSVTDISLPGTVIFPVGGKLRQEALGFCAALGLWPQVGEKRRMLLKLYPLLSQGQRKLDLEGSEATVP